MNGLKQHIDCSNYNQDCLIFLQNNLEKYYAHIIRHIVALISSLMAVKRLSKKWWMCVALYVAARMLTAVFSDLVMRYLLRLRVIAVFELSDVNSGSSHWGKHARALFSSGWRENIRLCQHWVRHAVSSNMCSIVSATGVQMDRWQHVLHQRRYGLLSFWWRKVSPSCLWCTRYDHQIKQFKQHLLSLNLLIYLQK